MVPQQRYKKWLMVISGGGWWVFASLVALVLILSACGSEEESANPSDFVTPLSNQAELHLESENDGHEHTHLTEDELTGEVRAVMVPSEIAKGPSRFAVGLFDAQGGLIHDATVHFHYYDLRDPEKAVLLSENDARRVQDPEGFTTIYAHDRDFDLVGLWGVEVEARLADGSGARQRLGFEVVDDTASLSPGEKAPVLNTPTLDDVDQNLARLTTAQEPNPALHKLKLIPGIE